MQILVFDRNIFKQLFDVDVVDDSRCRSVFLYRLKYVGQRSVRKRIFSE